MTTAKNKSMSDEDDTDSSHSSSGNIDLLTDSEYSDPEDEYDVGKQFSFCKGTPIGGQYRMALQTASGCLEKVMMPTDETVLKGHVKQLRQWSMGEEVSSGLMNCILKCSLDYVRLQKKALAEGIGEMSVLP